MPIRPQKIASSRDSIRSKKMSSILIIKLIVSNQTLDPLESQKIEKEDSIASDYIIIQALQESLEKESKPREVIVIRQQIDLLLKDKEALRAAKNIQRELSNIYLYLIDNYLLGDIKNKVNQLEVILTEMLDKHTKQIKLYTYFKYWQDPQTVEVYIIYSKAYKAYQVDKISKEDY